MPMNITKLPLSARLDRLGRDEPAYPEWAEAITRRVAKTPITSYMADCPAELDQLGAALGLTQEQVGGMTYADVATYISPWYTSYSPDEPQRHAAALQAVELLAAPLLREYQMYAPSSDDDEDFEGDDL